MLKGILSGQAGPSGSRLFSTCIFLARSPHLIQDAQKMSQLINAPTKLWTHTNPENTQIHAFKKHVAQKYQLTLPTYHELWRWSVDHPAAFWEEIWHETGIIAPNAYNSVCPPN